MVAPFPSSEEENANLYMYKASVVDATPGPPPGGNKKHTQKISDIRLS